MNFKILYGNDTTEDCVATSRDELVNEKFGSAYGAFLEGGGEIFDVMPPDAPEGLKAPT